MFRAKTYLSLSLIVSAASVAILESACGGGSSSSSNNNMSQAQAQAVSQALSGAFVAAFEGAVSSSSVAQPGAHQSLSAVVRDVHPDQSSGCTSTATGQTCNLPVSYTGPCPGGGTIAVAGDFDGTLNNDGDGSINAALTITPASCSVSSLVINGDPSITVAGQIAFTDEALTFPVTLTESGGISFGPNPSGSCQLDVTYTINSQLACTVSGMVCGQSVSGSC